MKRRPLTPALSADVVGGEAVTSPRPDLIQRLAHAQAERARASLLRRLRSVESVDGARIVIDGRSLLNFASNDYLGLARHPALIEALQRAAALWGLGSTAAHLLGGHREEHAVLEEKLARWTGRERALLFSTGYMANLGALQALLGEGDLCVQDKLNHASLLDAAKLCGAQLKRYVHADAGSAARQLDTQADAAALLATDGVFSMDGDVAPLAELAALCSAQGATLMVDDAHGIGVLADGAGSLSEAGVSAQHAPVLMATLGRAPASAAHSSPAARRDRRTRAVRAAAHLYDRAAAGASCRRVGGSRQRALRRLAARQARAPGRAVPPRRGRARHRSDAVAHADPAGADRCEQSRADGHAGARKRGFLRAGDSPTDRSAGQGAAARGAVGAA
jgi:8-amino-7-oxononanoate synthase